MEQGKTEPRRTRRALEEILREQNIECRDFADGGFRGEHSRLGTAQSGYGAATVAHRCPNESRLKRWFAVTSYVH